MPQLWNADSDLGEWPVSNMKGNDNENVYTSGIDLQSYSGANPTGTRGSAEE